MALGKQAKILTEKQIKATLSHLTTSRYPARNRVMFLLSLHGCRAKEIAEIKVTMVLNSDGEVGAEICLENRASKGKASGRVIPMSATLQLAIKDYLGIRNSNSEYLIVTERSQKFSPNAVAVWFKRLYNDLGFVGASSHSGRRGFLTQAARKISLMGGSIRDVMQLSGHRQIATLMLYCERNEEAQRKIVDAVCNF